MKNNKLLLVFTHLLTALLAVAITLGAVLIFSTNSPNKLANLQALIDEVFIGEVNKVAIEDAAADAMVNALGDRWSYYIPGSQQEDYEDFDNNVYTGIGVSVMVREDGKGLEIVTITEGGPAQKAGLQVGDIITTVDGNSVEGLPLSEAHAYLQGDVGTKTELKILRGVETLTATATWEKIPLPVATATMLSGNIGLVTIENFNERSAAETLAAVEKLLAKGAEKMIFDVRFNPGGSVSELIQILDRLVPEGPIFRGEYYDGKIEEAHSDAKELNIPMAVLVNGDSYSAAEFFAAALQEYDKAIVVGQQTCGKGYFQRPYSLGDGSYVSLSIGKYYTPKGENLEGVGITPDVVVEVSDEMYAAIYYDTIKLEEDPQLQAAIAALNK